MEVFQNARKERNMVLKSEAEGEGRAEADEF